MNFKLIIFSILLIFSGPILASKVTVATFNINALVPIVSTSRINLICEEIKRSKADIIFLQEVWIRDYRNVLKDCNFPYSVDIDTGVGLYKRIERGLVRRSFLKTLSSFLSIFISPHIGYDSGLMILSKFPFEDNMPHSKLEFITNGHEDYFWDGEIAVTKGAVGVVINIRGKKVFVATTHLVASYSDSKYTEQRIDQLTQLKKWITESSRGLPTIIGGDFNFPTKNPLHLKTWEDIRENLWPKSSFLEVRDEYISDTHHEGVLDRLFGTNGALPQSGAIVFNESSEFLSDHLGFETVFNIELKNK